MRLAVVQHITTVLHFELKTAAVQILIFVFLFLLRGIFSLPSRVKSFKIKCMSGGSIGARKRRFSWTASTSSVASDNHAFVFSDLSNMKRSSLKPQGGRRNYSKTYISIKSRTWRRLRLNEPSLQHLSLARKTYACMYRCVFIFRNISFLNK